MHLQPPSWASTARTHKDLRIYVERKGKDGSYDMEEWRLSVHSLADSMLCMQNLLPYCLRSTWSWSPVRDQILLSPRATTKEEDAEATELPLACENCRDQVESREVGCLSRLCGVWDGAGQGRSWTALGDVPLTSVTSQFSVLSGQQCGKNLNVPGKCHRETQHLPPASPGWP